MYVRLASREEQELQVEFRDEYAAYVAVTPAFFPRLIQVLGKHHATQ
jgi:protein-S-isoprenylcysteine O-methyltransferase Ste14